MKRTINIINTVLCICIICITPAFYFATAMSVGAMSGVGFIKALTGGIPIVTIGSMILFWKNENKNEKVWVRASWFPWIYLLLYFMFLSAAF